MRPRPADFAETFVRLGWDGAQQRYRCHRRAMIRWLDEVGYDRLLAERQEYRRAVATIRARARRKCPRLAAPGGRSARNAIFPGPMPPGTLLPLSGPASAFELPDQIGTGFCLPPGDDRTGTGQSRPARLPEASRRRGAFATMKALLCLDGGRDQPVTPMLAMAITDLAAQARLAPDEYMRRLRWTMEDDVEGYAGLSSEEVVFAMSPEGQLAVAKAQRLHRYNGGGDTPLSSHKEREAIREAYLEQQAQRIAAEHFRETLKDPEAFINGARAALRAVREQRQP